ncbi:NADP-dependent oxidoreductase [Pseudonocardia alaniniphila]|uniref:NADP-dependent oxidoreductase n=1 Tax=Pseudonocardia alaniniphila TaxID=75291 RepID=A0ABS9TED0_9PSEU|nr:NADP-dependent oxidoreductase [Pseudonocardia alaniniphila]MCH6166894.1 NADP-dependent oxidoreductase [Pseudonocardia alaniniphila]
MGRMMALRAHARGGPEVLAYESAPWPTVGAGDVLVSVDAAAITFDELSWPETWVVGGVDRTPVIPSHEFSGVVVALGDGATGLSVGDEVFGLVPFDRDGAAAEYVSVPATSVSARPRTVSHVVAAAAVLPALTAWEALVDHAAVEPGQRVLVHGGAGGVGSFLVQLATALGASVTSTVRTRDVEYVRALGAERVINTEQESLNAETGVFDVVIDAVGRDVPEALFAALRRGGRLITLQEPPSAEMADKYGVTALFFIVTAERVRLARLAAMIDGGKLKVAVAATFPLAEGRAAYESGAFRRLHPGKTVLIVRF